MSLWWILALVPKNLLSRMTGVFVKIRWPRPIRIWLMRRFANHFKIRMEEAEFPLEDYSSIEDLFTRRLKPGLRPVAETDLIHPVDGVLTVSGRLEKGTLFQAKGITFSLAEFLRDEELAKEFNEGWFATYYLCPTDYHRVHSPFDGLLKKIVHLPGTLWPVNPWSVAHVPKLFAINERLNFIFETRWGRAVVSMVGATNVGEMTTPFAPALVTNRARTRAEIDLSAEVRKGDEIGTFNMGSTVVLVMPKAARTAAVGIPPSFEKVDITVLLGQSLALPVKSQA
jgi:phosphatidylserine decarboxylase